MKTIEQLESEIKEAEGKASEFAEISRMLCRKMVRYYSPFKVGQVVWFHVYIGSALKKGKIVRINYKYKEGFNFAIQAVNKNNEPSRKETAYHYASEALIKKYENVN